MKRTFLFLLLFGCSLVMRAQTADQKAVAAAVEILRKAMVDADKAALEKITADALSYGHSSGKIEDKAAFVDAIVTGKSDFKTIELADQTITVSENLALVRHKLSGETNNDGQPGTVNLGVLLVWQKQKGQWKLIGRQAFKL
ncbi:nuclear transport factor 2 family protein [Chryseolinea soli]|uniref:Nuclear transport factor 2 family protein n=1 Tax=Chryseolinea soli TaxID=2321403 RepID=A0A385SRR7_9BACT|nr:nuclear transport factor 2 family protein [Chryseolinea soli]AYB33869.1 nuclear transport factor 2 family protein [Chryseolinea soli]